jgi:hypothetical protein
MVENENAGFIGIVGCFKNVSMPDTPKNHAGFCPNPTKPVNEITALYFAHKGCYYNEGK